MQNTSKTKFRELCDEYEKVHADFKRIENNCYEFANELVKKFIAYLQVPLNQFSLYKIKDQNEFELVLPAIINALSHAKDSNWHFGMGLTASSSAEGQPQDLILIHVFIREDSQNKFYAKIALEPQEFEIDRNKDNGYNAFFDFIQKGVIESYREGFQKFIGHNTSRKIGYKINNSEQ